jgi:hypothetical protein
VRAAGMRPTHTRRSLEGDKGCGQVCLLDVLPLALHPSYIISNNLIVITDIVTIITILSLRPNYIALT